MTGFEAFWFVVFFGPLVLVRLIRTVFKIIREVAP